MENSNHSVKHTIAVTLILFAGALLIWIIQLARSGDPIGYIILTGLGVLLALPIAGGVLALLIGALSKLHAPQPLSRDDLKSIREAQTLLRAHNQHLTQMLTQMQKNPLLLPHSSQPEASYEMAPLGPGQTRTPEGFVINWAAFDILDDDSPEEDQGDA